MTFAGIATFGYASTTMRVSAPYFTFPASCGRQVDVHVDIGGVEHGEDFAAGRQDLADIGDAILDAAVARRDQRVVGNLDAIEFYVVGCRVERMLEFDDPQVCRAKRRVGAVQLLLPLIQDLLGCEAFCTRVAARSNCCCARRTCVFCCVTLAFASSTARRA